MRLMINEIIKQATEMPRAQAIEFLKSQDSKSLRQVLRFVYDTSLEVLLPNTSPPWKKNDGVGYEFILYNESRRLRIFLKGGGYDNLPSMKREGLFIALLEQMHNDDAEIIANALTRKPIKGLTEKMVLEAFPDLYQTLYA